MGEEISHRFLDADLGVMKAGILTEFYRQAGTGLADPGDRRIVPFEDRSGGSRVFEGLFSHLAPTVANAARMSVAGDNVGTGALVRHLGRDRTDALMLEGSARHGV